MRLWLLVTSVLIVQEFASTNVALLAAHQAEYSAMTIACIFIAATATDLAAGYALGKWVQRRFHEHSLVKNIERTTKRFELYIGVAASLVFIVALRFVENRIFRR